MLGERGKKVSRMRSERKRLLVKVSTLYYMKGLNQQEIADRLRISRVMVSRMLSEARDEGIVNITIRNPFSEEHQYEQEIVDTFGIKDVTVINLTSSDVPSGQNQLARVGAMLLKSVLKDEDIVGVMAGRTIANVADKMEYFPIKNVQFIPLIGGWGSEGMEWHSNANARKMANTLKGQYYLLNAPAIVASGESREVLLQEKEICGVLERAKNATVALIGIGQVSGQASFVKSGSLHIQEIHAMKQQGAVTSLCTSFLDRDGRLLDVPVSSRMIGLSANDLRHIPRVIAIASGEDKVAAMTAALRGKWMDTLITDLKTAEAVLEYNRLHPVT